MVIYVVILSCGHIGGYPGGGVSRGCHVGYHVHVDVTISHGGLVSRVSRGLHVFST
jgi:hypothetical protein